MAEFNPNYYKIVAVDFDKTIVPWNYVYDTQASPFPGVLDAMSALRKRGFKIYILTSRLSDRWCQDNYQRYNQKSPLALKVSQYNHIRFILDKNSIPWDEMGADKIGCDVIFDDIAVGISEEYPLPAAIYDFLERLKIAEQD